MDGLVTDDPTQVYVLPDDNFVRRGSVLKVIDGDSVFVDIQLGFYSHEQEICRLVGLNARELHDPGGKEAREALAELLPIGTKVRIVSFSVDKYGGRFDATVIREDGLVVNEWLIANGWAARWDGTGQRPVPAWPR